MQVLVHKEGHDHKGLYKGPFRVLNYLNQWWSGPFYGQTPYSYEAAHSKIHHRYDNGLDDAHTNLDLDRSEPSSLLIYFPRFYLYWSGISCIHFFARKGMWSLARRMAAGFVYHHAVMAYFLYLDWSFGLAYVVYPFIEVTIFLGIVLRCGTRQEF